MAGSSDPLEDLLFSEVDEKAVSDLVGSLESQLVGRNANKSGACAKQHLAKGLASRANANVTSEQQQQQQQHKTTEPAETSGKAATSTPPSQAASPAKTGADPPGVSINISRRAPSSMETPRHYGTRKKRGGGGGGGSRCSSVNGAGCPSSPGSALSMTFTRTNASTYTVSSSSSSVSLDKGSPTIALQRLPSHIVASITQGRNGTSVSALIQEGHLNHSESAEEKPIADGPSTSPVPACATVGTSAVTQTQQSPSPSESQTQTQSQLSSPSQSQPQSNPQPQPVPETQTQPQPQPQVQIQSQTQPQIQPVQNQTQAQAQPRPAVPPQRITAPQLIVRPPQQQATIQLPPGFTIPPGMVLVRTELGQLMMVHQQALAQAQAQSGLSPRPAAPTSTTAFRVTAPQSPVTASPALQNKVVPSQTQSPAPQTGTTTATTATIRAPLAVTAPQQHPTALGPQGPTMAPPTAAGPAPGSSVISQEMQENVKKCKNFLATLIKLASHNSPLPETSKNVKSLVQDLLDAKIEPEEFTSRLQTELKSSPQPYLVPFLKKSLPALRLSLMNSQQTFIQPHQIKPNTVVTAPGAFTPGNAPRQPNCTITPPQGIKRPGVVGAQVRMPAIITQTVRPAGAVGKSPVLQAGKCPSGVGVQLSGAPKNKVNDPGGGLFRDDDDINDVASMAGVNLSEENARILATNSELVGTQIRSCKDEAFLPTGLLHRRILEMAKKFGVTEVPLEAVNFISHATQSRLRTMLEKVSSIAQHRMDSSKDEECYEQSSDVRSQLKFFEQLERLEKQRKDEQEREILLKAAKSRSRQEDPEQARLKQKAKEKRKLEEGFLAD
ncbi:transcription initiation factor TFIID subunit 4-like isoform X2 [Trichomycterus rosablanca]|uniref:transcription initiation factor TFIID subunit 4-like isoform X2 n=1 Tax=Trichomycterus rosablanca TaxID=2290929 RepID=UPI002F353BBD